MNGEYKIGEEIRIRCVEDKGEGCDKCCFYERFQFCLLMCQANERKDKKNIHFEIMED